MEVYHGRLLYHEILLQEFTVGGYCGSIPWEFTMGGSMQMIWLAMVGTLNQSNAITMISLLWWGALINQIMLGPQEFTTGGYCGSLLQEFTVGVYHGRLPQEFTVGGYSGSLLQEVTMGGYHGSLLWEVTMGVYCGRLLWEFTTGGYHGRLPQEVTAGG